jgi:hypothetical protein
MTLVVSEAQLKPFGVVQYQTTDAPISYQQKSGQHFFLTHIGSYS